MLEELPLVRGIVSLSNDGGPFVAWIFASGVLIIAQNKETTGELC